MPAISSSKPSLDGNANGAFEIGRTYGINGFVALQVHCPSNRIEQRFPIDLNLEIDEWRLSIDRQQGLLHRFTDRLLGQENDQPVSLELRVRLRHCYVRYACDGVSIAAASKYRSAIEIGAYSEKQAASDRSAATRERTGALGAGGTLSVKPSASADASYRIGSRWQGSATVERTIAASQDIYDVEAVPGGWRVGDRSYGDPLKRDGCLDGPYFTRPVEAYAHSCIGEFLPHNDKGTIRFDVTTHDGIQIETLDGETPSITDKNTATAAMRAKLAAICVERALADNDELILYSVAAVCRNADDRAPPPDGETSV
jgi:hypothetical protein